MIDKISNICDDFFRSPYPWKYKSKITRIVQMALIILGIIGIIYTLISTLFPINIIVLSVIVISEVKLINSLFIKKSISEIYKETLEKIEKY